jgi:plasmid stabilization system protein ParE
VTELVWAETALADLEALRRWVGRDSKPLADRLTETILEAVERALPFPRIGRTVAEVGDDAVRELLLRTFRIVYEAAPGRVAVIAVLHGGRTTERREPRRWEVY